MSRQNSFPRRKRLLSYLAALVVGPLVVWAAEPVRIEKTFDTIPDPEVSLSSIRGQVVVRGWEKYQVHTICNVASPRMEIDTETIPHTGKAERLQLKAHAVDPSVTPSEETTDCTLDVPAGASVDIQNRQGSIQIEKLTGQHARLESADAKITATDVGGHLTARSMRGDIDVVRPAGRVEAYSITGNLKFTDPTSKDLRANTNSGHISYQGDFAPAGQYILSTYSGNIAVVLPPSASFELTAKTVKGKVENAFSLKPARHTTLPFPSANSLFGTHSTGNATVELTSFSGRINLRPQP